MWAGKKTGLKLLYRLQSTCVYNADLIELDFCFNHLFLYLKINITIKLIYNCIVIFHCMHCLACLLQGFNGTKPKKFVLLCQQNNTFSKRKNNRQINRLQK